MFITLVDEKAGTEKPGLLVEITHDDTRGTIFVLDPETRTWSFEPRIPYGPDNAYIDDDGKHGAFFREGDPTDFPAEDTGTPAVSEPDETDEVNSESVGF